MRINSLDIEGIGSNGKYVDKNNTPGQERAGTLIKSLIYNQLIEEFQENFIASAGLAPSDTDTGQIKKAFDVFMNRLETKLLNEDDLLEIKLSNRDNQLSNRDDQLSQKIDTTKNELSNKDNQLSQKIDTIKNELLSKDSQLDSKLSKKIDDTENEIYSSLRGIIMAFAGHINNIPSNAFLCDGRELSRSTYSKLFAKLSTYWGSGNGYSTFNLPDLRGATLMGAGYSSQWSYQENASLAQRIQTHIRNITGNITFLKALQWTLYSSETSSSGSLRLLNPSGEYGGSGGTNNYTGLREIDFNASRSVSTGSTNTPNARGVNFIIFV